MTTFEAALAVARMATWTVLLAITAPSPDQISAELAALLDAIGLDESDFVVMDVVNRFAPLYGADPTKYEALARLSVAMSVIAQESTKCAHPTYKPRVVFLDAGHSVCVPCAADMPIPASEGCGWCGSALATDEESSPVSYCMGAYLVHGTACATCAEALQPTRTK